MLESQETFRNETIFSFKKKQKKKKKERKKNLPCREGANGWDHMSTETGAADWPWNSSFLLFLSFSSLPKETHGLCALILHAYVAPLW